MSSPDVTPICIPSDDDDSDVEIVREEKIDLDDGDVIFVSQTSPTKPVSDKIATENSGSSNVAGDSTLQDENYDVKPHSVISCHRSLSISSGLEMALNLHDPSEVGTPLDLSSRKSEDESEDSDSSTSFSSSDESSLLDISDQIAIKQESSLPCPKQSVIQTDDQISNSNIMALHSADNILPDNSSYVQNDGKPFSLCKFESLYKVSCDEQNAASSVNTSEFSNPGLSPSCTTSLLPIFPLSGPSTSLQPQPHTASVMSHMPSQGLPSTEPHLQPQPGTASVMSHTPSQGLPSTEPHTSVISPSQGLPSTEPHSSIILPSQGMPSTEPHSSIISPSQGQPSTEPHTSVISLAEPQLSTKTSVAATPQGPSLSPPVSPQGSLRDSVFSIAFDDQVQCSAPKKRKENSPDPDIWAMIRKDLDFLNDSLVTANAGAVVPKSLSDIPGASDNHSVDSKSHLNTSDIAKLPSSADDMKNSETGLRANKSSMWSSTLSLNDSDRSVTCVRPSSLSVIQTDSTSSRNNSGSVSTVSNHSNSIVKQLPPKKQRCFRTSSDPFAHSSTATGNVSSIKPIDTDTKWGSEKCSSCMLSLLGLKSSRCLQGHVTCGACLEERVKLVLTGKSKETLRCVQTNCDSYYPMSELKHSLPSMVVEILEDKLDNDYIDYIANMIMKNACPPSAVPNSDIKTNTSCHTVSSSTDVSVEGRHVQTTAETRLHDSSGQKTDDLPSNWAPMDKKAGFVLVTLKPESDEYVEVAFQFYNSMKFPTADIMKISRVQNHILWNYYGVKRLEMIHDNDGLDVEEKYLFHGTNTEVVDAICKKGFDWRVSGKHGTVYGHGSYFAVNASYSHQYTEKGNAKRPRLFRVGSYRMTINPQPLNLGLPPPAHAGASLANLPGIPAMQPNIPQFGPPSATSQGQGQTQGSPVPNTNSVLSRGMMPMTSMQMLRLAAQTSSASQTVNNVFTSSNSSLSPMLGTGLFSRRKFNLSQRQRLSGISSVSSEEPQENSTVHKMFMSKVLVGKYTGGNSGLRKPPPLYPDTDPYGKCYDSCVDNIMDPKIFVVFDSTQAYPEYLIEYNYPS